MLYTCIHVYIVKHYTICGKMVQYRWIKMRKLMLKNMINKLFNNEMNPRLLYQIFFS